MSQSAFETWQARDGHEGLRTAWLESRDFIASCNWHEFYVDCSLCLQRTRCELQSNFEKPDMREGLVCGGCGHNARVRAALGLLQGRLPLLARHAPKAESALTRYWQRLRQLAGLAPAGSQLNVYISEQATLTYAWVQRHFPANLHGGEFEPDPGKRKTLTAYLAKLGGHGKVVFRDVTRLGFGTGTIDAVISFDVLEHVPDYRAAISEFARILAPGGLCVATFPFNDRPRTDVRARLDGAGDIEHLMAPEYHGDPLGNSILCYYHFGWDVLDAFRVAGFRRAEMVMPYSLAEGLPYGMWTLLAER